MLYQTWIEEINLLDKLHLSASILLILFMVTVATIAYRTLKKHHISEETRYILYGVITIAAGAIFHRGWWVSQRVAKDLRITEAYQFFNDYEWITVLALFLIILGNMMSIAPVLMEMLGKYWLQYSVAGILLVYWIFVSILILTGI